MRRQRVLLGVVGDVAAVDSGSSWYEEGLAEPEAVALVEADAPFADAVEDTFADEVETTLAVRLVRRSDKLVIWEGKASQMAKAGSPAAQPGIAAAKLAEAMFKGFPGVSGETIRVP